MLTDPQMKAIRKFKGLLAAKRARQPPSTPSRRRGDKDATPGASPTPERSDTADVAAQILLQRQQFHAQGGTAALGLGIEIAERQPSPVVLGIGTGGLDTFSHPHEVEDEHIVSDSPTAVDFNIYDRAFDAEIDRIKRSTSRKGAGSRKGTGENTATTTLYRTRLNQKSHGIEGDEDGGEGAGVGGGLFGLFAAARGRGMGGDGAGRFADLVKEAMKQAEKRQQEGEREGAGKEKGQEDGDTKVVREKDEKENENANEDAF